MSGIPLKKQSRSPFLMQIVKTHLGLAAGSNYFDPGGVKPVRWSKLSTFILRNKQRNKELSKHVFARNRKPIQSGKHNP